MKDYIWGRIHALRKNNVIDFMTEYMRRTGANLEDMRNDPLQSLQLPSKSVNYAKVEKNMKSSEVKQGTYRPKEERE
tara:strand:- start:727 stop:957 length:231 start_codon:yes stop_codon:yes gene_type:complete